MERNRADPLGELLKRFAPLAKCGRLYVECPTHGGQRVSIWRPIPEAGIVQAECPLCDEVYRKDPDHASHPSTLTVKIRGDTEPKVITRPWSPKQLDRPTKPRLIGLGLRSKTKPQLHDEQRR